MSSNVGTSFIVLSLAITQFCKVLVRLQGAFYLSASPGLRIPVTMADADSPPDWPAVEPLRRSKARGAEPRSRLHRAEQVEVPAAARQLAAQLTALDRQVVRQGRARRAEARVFLQEQLERRRWVYQAARAAASRPESPPHRGRQRTGWRPRPRPRHRPRGSTLPSPAPRSVSLSVSSVQFVMLDWPSLPPPPGRTRSSSAPSVLVDALWAPGQRHSHCLSPPPPRRRPLSGDGRQDTARHPLRPLRQLRDSFCRELAQRAETEDRDDGTPPVPPEAGAEDGDDPVEAVAARLRRTLVPVEKLPPSAASQRCSRASPQPPPPCAPIVLRLTGSTAPY